MAVTVSDTHLGDGDFAVVVTFDTSVATDAEAEWEVPAALRPWWGAGNGNKDRRGRLVGLAQELVTAGSATQLEALVDTAPTASSDATTLIAQLAAGTSSAGAFDAGIPFVMPTDWTLRIRPTPDATATECKVAFRVRLGGWGSM